MPTPVCFTPAFRLIPGGKHASLTRPEPVAKPYVKICRKL